MPRIVKTKIKVLYEGTEYVERIVDGRPLTPHFAAVRPNDARKAVGLATDLGLDRLWNVTHKPTGAKIAVVNSLKKAMNFARAAEEAMPNVGSTDPADAVSAVDQEFMEYRRTDGSMTFAEFREC